MLGLGSLTFAVPWALAALAVLPVIWWLLRLKPPAPTRIPFPPIFLLRRLSSHEESPATTPPWLLALRLALAATIIIAAARPLINDDSPLQGRGPMYVIVDDDWAAAVNWPARQAVLADLVDQAELAGRPVAAVTTAVAPESTLHEPTRLMTPADARELFQSLQPKPWITDRGAAIDSLTATGAFADQRPGDVIWLSNGLEEPSGGDAAMLDLVASLQPLGATAVLVEPASRLAVNLRPPIVNGDRFTITVERPGTRGEKALHVRAIANDGQLLARLPMLMEAGQRRAETNLDLPTELLNRLVRLEIEGSSTAASVLLLDERWRRRAVGLVTKGKVESAQPLLSDLHYLNRALDPFTEVRQGSVEELMERELATIILADPGPLESKLRQRLVRWMEGGGVILRFAGPNLAQDPGMKDNPLLPVHLRQGDRVIGGAMSWQRPEALAPFDEDSPFHGLTVPGDVKVGRQVLAQPSLELAGKTWARLTDGTPLVTADKRGKGWLVLIHITANPEWSSLPLSGLFVEMLRRVVGLSQGLVQQASGPPLPPLTTLDGFGRLGSPPAGTTAVAADTFNEQLVSPAHPPGYYGNPAARRALNLSNAMAALEPIRQLPTGVEMQAYETATAIDPQPWLLGLAIVLLLADMTISMSLRGLLRTARLGVLILCVGLSTETARADDAYAMNNSLSTRLAYVITGDEDVDEISQAGLEGLRVIVTRRTAVVLGAAQGIDPASDELAFFPLIYWPVIETAADISETAATRINAYLRNGGVILFDTRDRAASSGALAGLARELGIPALVPVNPNHVLTRAFYLMREFPGRWAGGTLWVERAGERVNDGVSPVIAGAHDWAAAWAMDEAQRPMYPVVPGGERQRELAFRFGINLVMYSLTGNYKADQVHLPAIMKRLGQ